MDEIRAEVDVLYIHDFMQRRSHQQRQAEINDIEIWLFLFDERPERLLPNFLTNAVLDERILQFDGVFSVELRSSQSARAANLPDISEATYWKPFVSRNDSASEICWIACGYRIDGSRHANSLQVLSMLLCRCQELCVPICSQDSPAFRIPISVRWIWTWTHPSILDFSKSLSKAV